MICKALSGSLPMYFNAVARVWMVSTGLDSRFSLFSPVQLTRNIINAEYNIRHKYFFIV